MAVGDYLNVARVIERTQAEGPGLRLCVWVQGCAQNCPGCCNRSMQPFEPREVIATDDLIRHVEKAWASPEAPEGITLLGGEPFLQAVGLARVAERVRKLGGTVLTFSGYTLEELHRGDLPGAERLLAATDVLVDGPYLAQCTEKRRNWVGSMNQRFHYLTDAYDASIETDPRYRRVVELREESGRVYLNGCPHVGDACRKEEVHVENR